MILNVLKFVTYVFLILVIVGCIMNVIQAIGG